MTLQTHHILWGLMFYATLDFDRAQVMMQVASQEVRAVEQQDGKII
jgi:hypothetical protein